MAELSTLVQWNLNDGLVTFGDYPCLLLDYRTHLYIEQAISDLLGEKQSSSLRMSVARDAVRELVSQTAPGMGVEGGAAMFPYTVGLYRMFGCGRLRLETVEGRRRGVGDRLFSSMSRLQHPELMATVSPSLEAMTSGWLAAAIELALSRPANSVEVRQGGGPSNPEGYVWFDLGKGDGADPRHVVRGSIGQRGSWSGPAVSAWVAKAASDLLGMEAEQEGVRHGLGVPMCLMLAGYHQEAVLTARAAAFSASTELGALLDAALVEAWRLGFSGWLHERWQRMGEHGEAHAGQPADVMLLCSDLMALLGLGRVRFTEIGDGGIRAESPGTLDALWTLQRVGVQRTAVCLSLLGIVQAVADFVAMLRRGGAAEQGSWTREQLTPSPFTPEVITCVSVGSSITEVVAKRAARIGGYVPVEAS